MNKKKREEEFIEYIYFFIDIGKKILTNIFLLYSILLLLTLELNLIAEANLIYLFNNINIYTYHQEYCIILSK